MKVSVIECNYSRKNKILTIIRNLGWDLLIELDNFEDIAEYLDKYIPDLIIANMSLGSESSIKLFIEQTTKKKIPVLFLTHFDNNDDSNYSNFLLNPFNQEGLQAALTLVMPTSEDKIKPVNGIEISGKQQQKILIPFEEILWIEVERNYCFIKTQNNRYGVIRSLSKLMTSLDRRFIQIHRGCVVNSDYIDLIKMSKQELKIKNTVWTIGRLYKKNVLTYLANKR